MLAKKQNKLERKVEDLSNKLERISLEKIAVEEQAIKYQMLTEEVVAKLKPLLTEDMVEILTYYENKLKNTAYVDK
jgi:ABC-type thiamine transport system ATPase subunit